LSTTSALAAPPLPPGPATSLTNAFQTSSANFAQALLCPVGKKVKQVSSTIPGVATLTDQLANVLCALSELGYAYRTTYLPASGQPVVRYFRAVAGVPIGMDVDGDGRIDFTGQLSPTLVVPGAQLSITRTTSFPASARVRVEAVLLDPASTTTFVGVGEDGSAAGTAKIWRLRVGAFLSSGSSVDLQLALQCTTPPTSIASLGEAFFGSNPDAPSSIDAGTLGFANPVPSTFTTRLRIGPTSQEVTATASVRSTLTAHAAAITSTEEKDVDVIVNQIPTTMDVMHQSSSGHDVETYTASSPIAHLTGMYHDRAGSTLLTAAQLDVTSLPSKLTVDQDDAKTILSVPSGVIGAVEARYATGQDVPASPPGVTPYVSLHRYASGHLTAGLRLGSISSVSFDGSGPYVGDIVFGTAPGLIPLSFVDDVSGISATGHLSNLPAHVTVGIDLPNGQIVFNGHGTGISELAISATDSHQPFFAKATRLDVTLDGLPPVVTVDVKQDTNAVTYVGSAPIGSVSLLASDGTGPPTATGDYASFEWTPTLWRAFLQIDGVTKFGFSPSPISGTIQTNSAQVMTLYATLQDATNDMTFTGSITKLPSQIDFSIVNQSDGSQVIDYNSHGQAIDSITVDATGLPIQFGADTLHAEIDHLPSHLTATIPAPYGTAVFDPHGDTIGRVLVEYFPHALGPHNPIANQQMLFADLTTGQFTADIKSIGYNSFYTSSPAVELQYDISSEPLEVYLGLNDGTYVDFQITNPEPASIVGSTEDRTSLDYTVNPNSPNYSGDGSINGLSIMTDVGGAWLNADLNNIAPHVHICLAGDNFNCDPNWVPQDIINPNPNFGLTPSFAFQLYPTDLAGHDWPTRMTLNVLYCPSEADAQVCGNPDAKKDRLSIDNLQFGTLDAGFGNHSDDCGDTSIYCGRAFVWFNTDGTHITGDAKFYEGGDDPDSPTIEYSAADPGNYLSAHDWFFYDSYDVPNEDRSSTGTLNCIGSPKLQLSVADFGFDLLKGDLGVC